VEYTLTRSGAEPITAGRDAVVRVATLQEALRTDESILLQQELMAAPGDYTLSVRVSDRTSNLTGVATDSVTVPAFEAGSITEPILCMRCAVGRPVPIRSASCSTHAARSPTAATRS
jgi:hypothetical protein